MVEDWRKLGRNQKLRYIGECYAEAACFITSITTASVAVRQDCGLSLETFFNVSASTTVMAWLSGNTVRSTKLLYVGPVSTGMGDHLRAGKPSWYVTSHPGQFSLVNPPWLGTVSTSESWGVNRHTTRCTSPVSVVW